MILTKLFFYKGKVDSVYLNCIPMRSSWLFNTKHPVLLNSSLSLRKFFSTKNNPNSFVPVKIYENADILKEQAVKENKKKSGVYLWKNNVNGNSYVGSSVDLGRRFKSYFNYNYITDPKNKMLIHRALIKHGYSNFSLLILEYCEVSNVIEKEQYYLDYLNPEYNTNKIAGSRLGSKHTEETLAKFRGRVISKEARAKLSAVLKGKVLSKETRAKMSKAKTGKNHPMYGTTKPEGAGTPSKRVEVLNISTNESIVYDSISIAARAIGVKQPTISMYIKSQKPYKKLYIFKLA